VVAAGERGQVDGLVDVHPQLAHPGPNGPSRMTVGGTTSQPVAWLTR
jgi:hypothetical protein